MNLLYVRYLLFAMIATVMGSMAINLLVDPYGLYRLVEFEGFNVVKPRAGMSGRMIKPRAVEQIRPRTLLLGNSRTEAGIDPASQVWPASAQPVYNMGLQASEIDTALMSLQHVNQISRLETVVLGLDFLDFPVFVRQKTPPPNAQEPTEFELRLRVDAKGHAQVPDPVQGLKDGASSLASLNALTDSLITVMAQRLPDQVNLTSRGFNPMREYVVFARNDGYPTMFRQMSVTYLTNYLRGPRQLFTPGQNTSPALENLREIIRVCRERNIRLLLFIHPYHAQMLEAYRIAGLWPLFEDWKRELARVVSVEGDDKVVLWDFSGYNEVTMEKIPRAKGQLMKFYWELGHYKAVVGDRMLKRMLSDQASGHQDSFGIQLTPEQVEAALETERRLRDTYVADRTEEMTDLTRSADIVRTQMKLKAASVH